MLYLREITREDIPEINRYRYNKDLVNHLGAPFRFVNIETEYNWFDNYMSSRNSNVRLAICSDEDNSIIGLVYLVNINWIFRRCDFGILLGDEKDRGKNNGYIAIKMILEHAFNDLQLNRVEVKVLESNTNAISIYKKVGFIQEGVLRQSVYKEGRFQNQVIMSILKEKHI